ncbi:sensor histidine kinase [Pedobacter sp. FW305-3-2-15-E-R2A2]|uniref:sensor histidine kinase n=1 Tax=Pedobacter sp. FW305-3-2-15-E-R2A2 TaxID=3140251 RepID=UPI0031409B40
MLNPLRYIIAIIFLFLQLNEAAAWEPGAGKFKEVEKELRLTLLYQRFRLDSASGKYRSAFSRLLEYHSLKDSISKARKAQQISDLRHQFKTEERDLNIRSKQKHIDLLTRERELQKAVFQSTLKVRNVVVGSVIVLFLLLAIVFNKFRLKYRSNQQLQMQQSEISTQNESMQILADQKDVLLEQKEWLMKEVHHRVKNNLQVVISLLNIQSAYLQDEQASASLKESQNRMQSISLIHQKLYQSESRARINMQVYIKEFIDYLKHSFNVDTGIRITIDVVSVEFDVILAVPLGLILNEAITNAIKYAFCNRPGGNISIVLSELGDQKYVLKVIDDGVGITEGMKQEENRSLGMSLMKNLSQQINGEFMILNKKGCAVILQFAERQHVFSA